MCAHVLVIDDDPVNLDLMTYLLNAFGHAPIAASGGEAALQTVRSTVVDLVLCDIQMPGVDGFEFLRRLSEMKPSRPPVIGVTALAMVGDREKILSAGFDGYMAKPISPDTFVEEVERYLAASERAGHEPKAAAAPAPYVRPPATERKNVRVLVADNEPANVEILRLLLDHWGYDVLAAPSGRAALDLARREQPHVIISDLHMPDGDGLELLEATRTDPLLRETPIIFVSATNPRPRAIEKAAALGAAHFLLRPFEPDVLLGALAECLARAGPNGG
jgi:two-component system cell cycle response regulator